MSDEGPQLVRPIPRRPFNFNFTSATPPDDEMPARDALSSPHHLKAALDRLDANSGSRSSSLSRPQSFMNLTSSTLYGIYSPITPTKDRVFGDRDENDTPLEAGAHTPLRRPSVDDATFEVMRERAHSKRRHSTFRSVEPISRHDTSPGSVIVRTTLLFTLGLGYGVLVTRFQQEQYLTTTLQAGIGKNNFNSSYLTFWGVGGVVLGSLLPWFDQVWEEAFASEDTDETVVDSEGPDGKEAAPNTDVALIMRAIGAFVGIIFAIRKLAWSSTLQISITLALVNPLLWWLIDRSKPGFLFSAFVGLTGSALLLGVNPDIIPTPARQLSRNMTTEAGSEDLLMLGGLATQRTVETGVWMLSVLFCSCVCFGNIGRRLTWGKSTAAKGRWAGVR